MVALLVRGCVVFEFLTVSFMRMSRTDSAASRGVACAMRLQMIAWL
jgi:hypothetical protein